MTLVIILSILVVGSFAFVLYLKHVKTQKKYCGFYRKEIDDSRKEFCDMGPDCADCPYRTRKV